MIEGDFDYYCGARWATANNFHAKGDVCCGEVYKWLGDVPLCQHHYERLFSDVGERIQEKYRESQQKYIHEKEQKEKTLRDKSVVYYLKRVSDGYIKIGYSSQFKTRLKVLTKEHGLLEVLATHKGWEDAEDYVHKMFPEERLSKFTDWFKPSDRIFAHIENIKRKHKERLSASSQ